MAACDSRGAGSRGWLRHAFDGPLMPLRTFCVALHLPQSEQDEHHRSGCHPGGWRRASIVSAHVAQASAVVAGVVEGTQEASAHAMGDARSHVQRRRELTSVYPRTRCDKVPPAARRGGMASRDTTRWCEIDVSYA